MRISIIVFTIISLAACKQTTQNSDIENTAFYTQNKSRIELPDIKNKWDSLLSKELTNIELSNFSIKEFTDEETNEKKQVLILQSSNYNNKILAELKAYKKGYLIADKLVCCKNCDEEITFRLIDNEYACNFTAESFSDTTTLKCKKITMVYFNDEPDQNIRTEEQELSKDFLISIRYIENKEVKMKCEGCAWKNLNYYNLNRLSEEVIDEYGMLGKNEPMKGKVGSFADFEIIITPRKEKLAIKGIKGTDWKELTLNFDTIKVHEFTKQGKVK